MSRELPYGKGWFVKGEKNTDWLDDARSLALSGAHQTFYQFINGSRSPVKGRNLVSDRVANAAAHIKLKQDWR